MVAKKKPLKSLSAGRPPLTRSSRTMSRKASRSLINKHHQLEKQKRQAASAGDSQREAAIDSQIEQLGGIMQYQAASLQGQSTERGGDTSRVLLDWLPMQKLKQGKDENSEKPRLLEVGSLSTRNACSASGVFDTVHIDLNSQEPGIEQQDFMERPLPQTDAARFDIISLSLVVNFVPDAAQRGEMLRRTLQFLRNTFTATTTTTSTGDSQEEMFPSLFLVLPRSCLDNSRYFTDERLLAIMQSLGYTRLRSKTTQKLAYSLWRRDGVMMPRGETFDKKEVNPGRSRNNFVITLKRQR